MTAVDRRAAFRALHEQDRLFLMPNPWDVGSARLLAAPGFEALATTSAGLRVVAREARPAACRATSCVAHVRRARGGRPTLPLNVDSERLLRRTTRAASPRRCALLAEAGAAGCSIEDYDPASGDDRRRSSWRPSEWRWRPPRRTPRRTAGADGAVPRTTSTASTTSTTRSPASWPTATPAPTSSTRPGSPTSGRSPAGRGGRRARERPGTPDGTDDRGARVGRCPPCLGREPPDRRRLRRPRLGCTRVAGRRDVRVRRRPRPARSRRARVRLRLRGSDRPRT